ncbi:MAG: binding protein excisionase family [Actinomycetia bacterium]|nr:binding protein excisionase family [Actinomycetes bacterium]
MTEGQDRDPDVLTTKELAIKLGLSPQTVRRMANAGQIPALKTGKDFRYSWEAVRDVLRQPHRSEEHSNDDENQPEQPDPKRRQGAGYRAQRHARTGAQHVTDT